MCTQQTDSVELEAAFAADSSAPSESLAASIPPELFKNVLAYVGDEDLLVITDISDTTNPNHVSAIAARRDEMRHLSACTLTCLYWAQLTRHHLFQRLVLRSSEDMSGLLSFIRAPQSPRIPPICDILRYLYVYYTLGDHPWFHNLAGLPSRYRISNLEWLNLCITGPATPAFVAASTRGSMLHPLFFATPRVLPIIFPESCNFFLSIMNIHLPNPTLLSNLFQDCSSLRPILTCCVNLTWDLDPAIQATPSLIGLKDACHTSNGHSHDVAGCTDNVLVATMLKSVPHHEASQRRQGLYLDPLETFNLFNVMRTTRCGLSPELDRTTRFGISSISDSDPIEKDFAVRLPAATDFGLRWRVDDCGFWCIASRLPHATATGNNVRNITYIYIDLWRFDDHHELRWYTKIANIGWDVFLHTVRQFPHLRQVVIQCNRHSRGGSPRQILVEFLAHLGGAWFGLGELLGLYYKEWEESEWVQLRLDTLIDEIEQQRAEINAEADAEKVTSSELESSVVEKEPSTASADVQAQTSSVAASQDSRETFQLADGEVEILPEHTALLDEARQFQIEEAMSETDTNKAVVSELDPSVVVEEGSTHDE